MCWLGSTGDRFPKTFTCGSQNITAHWRIYRRALAGGTPPPPPPPPPPASLLVNSKYFFFEILLVFFTNTKQLHHLTYTIHQTIALTPFFSNFWIRPYNY